MASHRPLIAVVGDGTVPESSPVYRLAERLGEALTELAFAWIHRRLVLGFRVPGWSGRLAGTRIDDRMRFRSIPDDQVFGVDTPEEAVEILRRRLAAYEEARREEE